jgi:hypothetical protein
VSKKTKLTDSITITTDHTLDAGQYIITSTPYSNNTIYTQEPWYTVYIGNCSKCKAEGVEIAKEWNWTDDQEIKDKLQRKICKKCYTQALDKLFDLENNLEAEVALYERPERKK